MSNYMAIGFIARSELLRFQIIDGSWRSQVGRTTKRFFPIGKRRKFRPDYPQLICLFRVIHNKLFPIFFLGFIAVL
jgi:hypothetical protein